jgi:hypothetical protein
MSISTLTLSPFDFNPSVVLAKVWGIKAIETLLSFTSTTVRLTPSIAIDPLETIDRKTSLFSIFIHIFLSVGDVITCFIVPVASTWPRTICPSNLSPNRKLLSIFTLSPGLTKPRQLRLTVSSTISKSAVPLLYSFVIVRQAPLILTLLPTFKPL